MDLSIVVVNFNTAHFLPPLVESIESQAWTTREGGSELEIIVVDNASKGADATMLAPLRDRGVRFVQNTMNVGYGPANNQGFAVARGRFHMVLNPDCRFLPGCFQELITALETVPDAAIVGPLAYMDPEATCMMPPNEMPTPDLFELQTRAQVDVEAARENLRERTRFAHDYWTASDPHEMDMLSGSCLLFRRDLFGGAAPFDPGYPLYYEDTDMFMRLRRDGRRLFHVPTARMLHYWSQSADRHARGAEYRHGISAARFYEKHFGADGLRRYRENAAQAEAQRDAARDIPLFEFLPISAGDEPPTIPLDEGEGDCLIEFAGNPVFTLAVGMIPARRGSFTVSPVMWAQLGPGDYWIRAIDRETFDTRRAWIVTKRG